MERILCVYHIYLEKELTDRISTHARELGFTPYVFNAMIPEEKKAAYEMFPRAEVIFSASANSLQAAGKNLRWFASSFAGVDSIVAHPEYFPSEDVVLTSSNVYGHAISEHVILVLLMLFRQMQTYEKNVSAHIWTRNLPVDGIVENTFFVVGTGNLGQNIADRLRGLHAGRIVGINRSGHYAAAMNPFDEIYPVSELDRLLPEANNLIFAVPMAPGTDRLLTAERIAHLPNGARIVNVGRGNCVDENAVAEALNSGKLAGAALDVFEKEPIPEDSPLWTAKNLIITPHISGNMSLYVTRRSVAELFIENLDRYAAGEPLKGLVDLKRGY